MLFLLTFASSIFLSLYGHVLILFNLHTLHRTLSHSSVMKMIPKHNYNQPLLRLEPSKLPYLFSQEDFILWMRRIYVICCINLFRIFLQYVMICFVHLDNKWCCKCNSQYSNIHIVCLPHTHNVIIIIQSVF